MDYAIFTRDGNLLESFPERDVATSALRRMVMAEPEALEEVVIVVLGDDGVPTGEAILPRDPAHTSSVVDTPRGTNVQGQASSAQRGSVRDVTSFHGWAPSGQAAPAEAWGKFTVGPEVTLRETPA